MKTIGKQLRYVKKTQISDFDKDNIEPICWLNIFADNQNNILSNFSGSVNTDGGDILINLNIDDTVYETAVNEVSQDEELIEDNGVITLKEIIAHLS